MLMGPRIAGEGNREANVSETIDQRWARYEKIAAGQFMQSNDTRIQDFFERMEREGSAVFADCYSGDMSFFNAPRRSDLAEIDIACVGVPFEVSAPVRAGARLGPRSFREWSRVRGPVHDSWRTIPFDLCSVADYGDIAFESPHSIDACVDRLKDVYAQFREAGIAPLSVGGVHTLTHPILAGLTGGKPVGMVHIDAHSDTSRGEFQGNHLSDCSVFLNAVLDRAIDPERVVQIGIRGSLTHYWDFSRDVGMRVIPMDEFFEIGVPGTLAEIRRVVGDGPFYFTMDCDGIDATFLPGTQLPEPFGLTTREVLQLVRGLRGMNMMGADIVELCPPYDPNGISANIAAAIGFELLCLLAESHAAHHRKARKTHW